MFEYHHFNPLFEPSSQPTQRSDPVGSSDHARSEDDFVDLDDDLDDDSHGDDELDEKFDEDLDEEFLNAKLNFFNRTLTDGFIEGRKNSPPQVPTNNLTRIQPIIKRLPIEPQIAASNAMLEFDWDLDPAEDKHKWHHKKKKKKKHHHHKKKKHIHHHWHWKSKKKCDHHHWHKHKV